MSSKSNEKSTEGSSQGVVSSVYDFLYYDAVRIGSFLGQFDPDGLLQSRKRIAGIGRTAQNRVNHSVKGGVPLVAEGSGNYENSEGERFDKGAEHVYDPLWANALQFLEYLEERELLSRDVPNAKLGSFVLLRGSLSIRDMGLLKAMVENSVLKKWFSASIGGSSTPSGPRQAKQQATSEAELILALMPLLPHLIQAIVQSGNLSFWSALNPDRLSLSTGDLMLKHGSVIEGEWSMLGVLDALPDARATTVPTDPASDLTAIVAGFTDTLRPLVGRPASAYGITPLIIFREVSTR
jgi:hypothetical protein